MNNENIHSLLPEITFREAPLVNLIKTDLTALTQDELQAHLAKLREMRASPQTARAKTEQRVRKTKQAFDFESML